MCTTTHSKSSISSGSVRSFSSPSSSCAFEPVGPHSHSPYAAIDRQPHILIEPWMKSASPLHPMGAQFYVRSRSWHFSPFLLSSLFQGSWRWFSRAMLVVFGVWFALTALLADLEFMSGRPSATLFPFNRVLNPEAVKGD